MQHIVNSIIPRYRDIQLRDKGSVDRACLGAITMKLTPKEKGKAAMTRSIHEIIFSTDMAAMDYEPTREEETFLQLIGLDRFITRVTWEIINVQVIQKVINNLNINTMETTLNGHIIPIFSKDWRHKMKAVFYLNTFLAKREPGTPRYMLQTCSLVSRRKCETRWAPARSTTARSMRQGNP